MQRLDVLQCVILMDGIDGRSGPSPRLVFSIFRALLMFVSLYLHHLLDSAKTNSPLDTAVYSIRWEHTLPELPSPTEHPLVQSTYEGCRRILAKPRQPKDPVQPQMLENLEQKHGHSNASPADLRLLFIVLVEYSGFLRIVEILSIQVKHIRLVPEGIVHIPTKP